MKKVRFRHFHEMENGQKGRLQGTIAAVNLKPDLVAVAGARVAPNDMPVKEMGRHISLSRLEKFKEKFNKPSEGQFMMDNVKTAISSLRGGNIALMSVGEFKKLIKQDVFSRRPPEILQD